MTEQQMPKSDAILVNILTVPICTKFKRAAFPRPALWKASEKFLI